MKAALLQELGDFALPGTIFSRQSYDHLKPSAKFGRILSDDKPFFNDPPSCDLYIFTVSSPLWGEDEQSSLASPKLGEAKGEGGGEGNVFGELPHPALSQREREKMQTLVLLGVLLRPVISY
jgi:hypothetical protein